MASEFIDILVCPACKGPVEQDKTAQALLCQTCRLAFPVRDLGGKLLPVMLVEEASPMPGDQETAKTPGTSAS
ncbi:MAG: Trm112 family protein [Desulfobulbaceae bacterium]|nr:Trm112 family protein [Desulfobulbaceae bacterium]